MYSRPKPGETEEDLLRLQEEFERNRAENKIQLAAKVVSAKNKDKKEDKTSETLDANKAEIEDQLANTFEAIPTDIQLSNIVENNLDGKKISQFKYNKGRGFPQAKRRDPSLTSSSGSIFSQQMKKLKKDQDEPMEVVITPINELTLSIKEKKENESKMIYKEDIPSQSFIVSGADSTQIHEENVNIIKSMSEQEILEEKERLMSTMDPAIISFLKSKRKKEVIENRNPTIQEQNEAGEDINIEDIESAKQLLMVPKAENWLNFDVVETNKLAWMKNIDIPKMKKSEGFEARFDFDGWLLPYAEPEINEKNRILYHHGEEPGRPGYTLQELFQLSRSSVIQQKILALNSIAKILSLNSTGVYDDIIDLPIEQIFFVVRFCLDDNTPAVLNASIKAMRNVVFSQVDEICLDSLLGFGIGMIQPTLAVDNEMEDDNTVNDQQLIEKNLIKCLARTEIFTRIRYIINTVKPALETIIYCLDIVIRLARDNDFIVSKILSSEGLLDGIVKNFIPKVIVPNTSGPYGLPLQQSIKLLRVLSSRSFALASKLLDKYKPIESLIVYLSNDAFSSNVNGLRLQIECMHYWSLLLHYGLTFEYFGVVQPILHNLLDYHFKNTNIEMGTTFVRQGHLAALLNLLTNVVQKNYTLVTPFVSLLMDNCFPKWCSQFSRLDSYACGKLQIISSLLNLFSHLIQYQQNTRLDDIVDELIHSQGFQIVTEHIKSGSMLLNNYEAHKTSSNLKSLEAAVWHTMDHVVPLIQTNSCIPFLCSLSKYVRITNNNKVKMSFLEHPNIQLYLKSLQQLEKYYLTNHWFARAESTLLMNILKTSVTLKQHLDTSMYYELAVKCLSVFNTENKPDIDYLLENIIFCSNFYPSEVLMEKLDINQRNTSLELSLSHLGEILQVYSQVLGLKNDILDLSTTCCIDISVGNVIPIDWIYTPILILYSNQQQNKNDIDEAQQIFTIRNCLRWILIYETYFPFLASTINPTDRFCRLACVFLGSDSLFLTPEIHNLLELCLKNVISKYEKDFNFSREIQGLSNFQDFYTQLLEQYQAVSYGDVLFGNVVLVPLAQRHKTQYRKTLWSEYGGVAEIFSVTPDKSFCELDAFLNPPETDMSLLQHYKCALMSNSVRATSILYRIAKHHVEAFIAKQKKS